MGEWRNEISGSVTGPVVQAGRIEAVYLPGDSVSVAGPPLTSWADRPELPDAVRDLLAAQQRATATLPYKMLGIRDPGILTQVYVQQSLGVHTSSAKETKPEPGERAKPHGEPGDRTMALGDAMNRESHLLITGEPGSGKSTLGYLYVQQIASYWLTANTGEPPITEPVLPLRVPARALTDNRPWAEQLARGVEDAVGRWLSTPLAPELFRQRALGARWLAFVDGLDEIIDVETRTQVIAVLAHQIRQNPGQRLVITTRQLGDDLRQIEEAGAQRFEIQPFGAIELTEFAQSWFRVQTPIRARERAEEFVGEVRDSRLNELMRNPLQATIAAIAKTIDPDRPLPNSRADLYQRFMAYLLEGDANRRDAINELRKPLDGQPARRALVDWLYEHRVELVEHLAARRLASEEPLLASAHKWVEAADVSLPELWREDVLAVLTSTGLFASDAETLVFRHHTFAEFLAARKNAGEIPSDFPNLDEWIARGLADANELFALFTFILWGQRDHDIDRVFTALLTGTRDTTLLAGKLLAEHVTAHPDTAARVLGRLLDLLVANGALAMDWLRLDKIGDVIGSIHRDVAGPSTVRQLVTLRDTPALAQAIRVECAVALGKLADAEDAARWLAGFAETADWATLRRVTTVLPELVTDGGDRAERLLLGHIHDDVSALLVIRLLLDCNRDAAARDQLLSLCRRLRDRPDGPRYLSRVKLADEWSGTQAGWAMLADVALESGCPREALWAAQVALSQQNASQWADAISIVLEVAGAGLIPDVVATASGRPAGLLVDAADQLHYHGHMDAALSLAREAMVSDQVAPYDFGVAAALLVTTDHARELLEFIDENPHITAAHIAWLPVHDATSSLIVAALRQPGVNHHTLRRATRDLLEHGGPTLVAQIVDAAREHDPEHWAAAAVALHDTGHVEQATELIRQLVQIQVGPDVLQVLGSLCKPTAPVELRNELLPILRRAAKDPGVWATDMVELLSEAGLTDEAQDLARSTLTNLTDGSTPDGERVAARWMRAGGFAVAIEIVEILSTQDIPAEDRVEIADELAKAGALDAAVDLWLDVVRHHGTAVQPAVTAATRLVRSGHHERALAATQDALTTRVSATVKAQLDALRGWITSLSAPRGAH